MTNPWAGHRVLRSLIAAGLLLDVWAHWHLAPIFDPVRSQAWPHLTEGQLFRAEAVAALVAATLVVAVPRRWTAWLALLVAAAGVGAVLTWSFVNVGTPGPLPDMYDPRWYTEKTLSLVGEALAAVAALAWIIRARRARRRDQRAGTSRRR